MLDLDLVNGTYTTLREVSMKTGSPDARRIVAELWRRERRNRNDMHIWNDLDKSEYSRSIYTAHWAEARNAAVTASRILYGEEL